LVWCASAVVAAGAMYFGFASCGGYGWHKSLFSAIASLLAIFAVAVPSNVLNSVGRKVAFLAVLAVGYFFVEAMVAPFYPGPPPTFREYSVLFLQSLEFGPCG
jgi:hypothetical protein